MSENRVEVVLERLDYGIFYTFGFILVNGFAICGARNGRIAVECAGLLNR